MQIESVAQLLRSVETLNGLVGDRIAAVSAQASIRDMSSGPLSSKSFKASLAEKELPSSMGPANSQKTRKKSGLFDDTVDANKDIQSNKSVRGEVDTDKLETPTEQVVSDSNSFEDLATESSGSEISAVGGQHSDCFGE